MSSATSPGALALRDLLPRLRRLDGLLERAAERVPDVYGAHVAGDRFRGLYVGEADVAMALGREPGSPTFGAEGAASGDDDLAPADSRVAWLAARYDLDAFDLDVIVLALAPELDLRYERLYAYLQDDVGRRRPTVDLALNLLCSSAADRIERRARFASDAVLLRDRLIDVSCPPGNGGAPLLAHVLTVDPQIVRFLIGEASLDSRLAAFCRVEMDPRIEDPWGVGDGDVRAVTGLAVRARANDDALCIQVTGPRGSGRRAVAAALARGLGAPLLTADVSRLGRDADFESLVATALRDGELRGAVVHLYETDTLLDDAQSARRSWLEAKIAAQSAVVVISASRAWPSDVLAGAPMIALRVPPVEQRDTIWRSELRCAPVAAAAACDGVVPSLASRFKLTAGHIAAAVRHASANAVVATPAILTPDLLFAAARYLSGRSLADLAPRVDGAHSWADLVLPDDSSAQLRQICERVCWRDQVLGRWGFGARLSRGIGTSALFSGPSGTGKTMAAEVMARELGVDLYRVDLAAVVSKYIGETEKNLDRIFAAADTSNGIVFFDEADALFGKRSEVHDAHDRYANIEISYLLQKMEDYSGIAILATNLRGNMDEAFLRRLGFVVHFPFPDGASRRRIWSVIWPAETPLSDDIDVDFLAQRFTLSGGGIKNVALAAAFLAAERGGLVTMSTVLAAARREYQKTGKQLTASDFAPYTVEGVV